MGNLTKNISDHELFCKCKYEDCNMKNDVDMELVNDIQSAVDHFEARFGKAYVVITSGNRCVKHNKDEGGTPGSYHTKKKAADFRIVLASGQVIPARDLAAYFEKKYPNSKGIGVYKNGRIHFDTRPAKARWSKNKA